MLPIAALRAVGRYGRQSVQSQLAGAEPEETSAVLEWGMSPYKGLALTSLIALLAIGTLTTVSTGQARPAPVGGLHLAAADYHLVPVGGAVYHVNTCNGEASILIGKDWRPIVEQSGAPSAGAAGRYEFVVLTQVENSKPIYRIDTVTGNTWFEGGGHWFRTN